MSAMKLTDSQADLLSALRAGVKCYYMPYMGRFCPAPYYFRADTHKRCTREVKALLDRGLVKTSNYDWKGHTVEAVEELEAQP